jgi:hypothetical protein
MLSMRKRYAPEVYLAPKARSHISLERRPRDLVIMETKPCKREPIGRLIGTDVANESRFQRDDFARYTRLGRCPRPVMNAAPLALKPIRVLYADASPTFSWMIH